MRRNRGTHRTAGADPRRQLPPGRAPPRRQSTPPVIGDPGPETLPAAPRDARLPESPEGPANRPVTAPAGEYDFGPLAHVWGPATCLIDGQPAGRTYLRLGRAVGWRHRERTYSSDGRDMVPLLRDRRSVPRGMRRTGRGLTHRPHSGADHLRERPAIYPDGAQRVSPRISALSRLRWAAPMGGGRPRPGHRLPPRRHGCPRAEAVGGRGQTMKATNDYRQVFPPSLREFEQTPMIASSYTYGS